MEDPEIGRSVRQLVTLWLEWIGQIDRNEREADLRQRVDGYRVVNGGTVDSRGSWEITDTESGELLGSGIGTESYYAAWQDGWIHVDRIHLDAFSAVPQPSEKCGLPEGLAEALSDWVTERPGEARDLIA